MEDRTATIVELTSRYKWRTQQLHFHQARLQHFLQLNTQHSDLIYWHRSQIKHYDKMAKRALTLISMRQNAKRFIFHTRSF